MMSEKRISHKTWQAKMPLTGIFAVLSLKEFIFKTQLYLIQGLEPISLWPNIMKQSRAALRVYKWLLFFDSHQSVAKARARRNLCKQKMFQTSCVAILTCRQIVILKVERPRCFIPSFSCKILFCPPSLYSCSSSYSSSFFFFFFFPSVYWNYFFFFFFFFLFPPVNEKNYFFFFLFFGLVEKVYSIATPIW